MDGRLLAYAERQAPRYTSYPPAPHFSTAIDSAEVETWLAGLANDVALSLYIHVPYCRQLCWYCGCNTYAARRDKPLIDFTDSLVAEIDLVSQTTSARRVVELHWGGGTPNILAPAEFERIFERLRARFEIAPDARHAIELDPRFLDAEKASAYAQAGVSRASLGVQDLNDTVQRAMGRVQPVELVERAILYLRRAGIARINMDLMYGLPHQTLDDLRRSIDLACALSPDRIALFGYAHVPWFKKRQRLIPEATLPNAEERFLQAESAREHLAALGYVAIGLDHFALPDDELAIAQRGGDLRRSFQGYGLEKADALVGIGPSAISTYPDGYAQNVSEPGAWSAAVRGGRLATVRGHLLSDDDRARGGIIEQIMCNFDADLEPLGGASACAGELDHLAPMFADGLVKLKGDRLILSTEARPLCRLVAIAFDAYAPRNAARHSKAV